MQKFHVCEIRLQEVINTEFPVRLKPHQESESLLLIV